MQTIFTQIPRCGLINPQFISNDDFGSNVVPQHRQKEKIWQLDSRALCACDMCNVYPVVVLFIDGIMAN